MKTRRRTVRNAHDARGGIPPQNPEEFPDWELLWRKHNVSEAVEKEPSGVEYTEHVPHTLRASIARWTGTVSITVLTYALLLLAFLWIQAGRHGVFSAASEWRWPGRHPDVYVFVFVSHSAYAAVGALALTLISVSLKPTVRAGIVLLLQPLIVIVAVVTFAMLFVN